MDLVKRKVTLEGDFDSDCLVNTKYEYWNGWVNPYLTYEDSVRFNNYRLEISEEKEKLEAQEDFDQIMKEPITHDGIKYYFWGGCFIWSYKENK